MMPLDPVSCTYPVHDEPIPARKAVRIIVNRSGGNFFSPTAPPPPGAASIAVHIESSIPNVDQRLNQVLRREGACARHRA